eukprot:scaffold148928_cov53-Attheya_sp.AAC.1
MHGEDGSSDKTTLPVENTEPLLRNRMQGPMRVAEVLVNAFSDPTKQRTPPSSRKTQHVRLITIGISHFCEKVRWGLDLIESDPDSALYYTEDAHAPGLAAFSTTDASNNTASATPMVVYEKTGEEVVLVDSAMILQELCPFLYPARYKDDILALEERLGRELGPTVRCLCYHYLLDPDHFDLLSNLCTANTSKVESILFKKMLPQGLDKGMRKSMGINAESAKDSRDAILKIFAEISDRLHGKTYLFGDVFTAADLCFAALVSPFLLPPELASMMGFHKLQDLPLGMRELYDQLIDTPAAQHALRMYELHRFGVLENPTDNSNLTKLVTPKSVSQDIFPLKSILAVCTVFAATIAIHFLKK